MIINQYSNSNYINTGMGGSVNGISEQTVTSNGNGSNQSTVLTNGDMVAGEVMSKSGKEVTLSLGNGDIVTAKSDIPADITVGSSILFNVKSSDSQGLVLSPLFTNMDTESPVSKALSAAGLVLDEKNVMMVNTMMNEGMNIGKSELLSMSSSLHDVSTLDIPDAVMLNKLGIEVNNDNIEQFGLYKNYEHQISGAVNEIMDLVTDSLAGAALNDNQDSSIAFATDLLDIFTSNGALFTDDNGVGILNMPVNELLSGQDLNELVSLLKENGLPEEFSDAVLKGEVSLKETMYVLDDTVKNVLESIENEETAAPDMEQTAGLNPNGLEADTQTDANVTASEKNYTDSIGLDFLRALTKNENQDIGENLSEKAQTDISKENLPEKNSALLHEKLLNLISSKSFGNILKTAINAQWKLIPEQVGEEKEVSNLYKRITEQTNRLLDSINTKMSDNTALADKASELNKNVNFMNEMNNMFNYVQLPMRLSGNDAHGDLYVYSNKKNLSSKDGTVSALLHLDMEHLGPTDIYVTMNTSNHVNTHFYMQDDYSLDLIAEHIDELNARLEKRGYSMSSEFSTRDNMTNVMTEIIEENKGNIPVSLSSFDARA